jgi:multiple sugar transport system permease protein
MTKRPFLTTVLLYVGVLSFVIFSIGPVYWMIASSIRPTGELLVTQPALFSPNVVFDSYVDVFLYTNYLTMLWNSFINAVVTTILTTALGAMAAYALVRLKIKGRVLLTRSVLISYLFPQVLLVVPVFMIAVQLGLVNTFHGLIFIYVTFSLPFTIWMLVAYFQSMPLDLEESAMVSGATRFQAFWYVVLPMSRPGLAAAGIFTFIHAWNEFLYALVLLNSDDKATLAIGLVRLLSSETLNWSALMAASTMMVVPVIAAFLFYQRNLVDGLTAGATKG